MYTARITREHRTAFIILCDHSGSMTEEVEYGGETVTKADALSHIINMMLEELINRSRREEGIKDYFDIGVIGYAGEGVSMLLPEKKKLITASQLSRMPAGTIRRHVMRMLPDGRQIRAVTEQRQWIEARAMGNTPMYEALCRAETIVREWCHSTRNRSSFPPIVINITDGEATDACYADLLSCASRIKSLSTDDGNALLFNIHISGGGTRISLPGDGIELPDIPHAKLLYDMSSDLPECYNRLVEPGGCNGMPPYRAVSYNCPIDELYGMLALGTITSNFAI